MAKGFFQSLIREVGRQTRQAEINRKEKEALLSKAKRLSDIGQLRLPADLSQWSNADIQTFARVVRLVRKINVDGKAYGCGAQAERADDLPEPVRHLWDSDLTQVEIARVVTRARDALLDAVADESEEIDPRGPVPPGLRRQVWVRDGGKCRLCGSAKRLEFDHIIPHSRGGATSVKNLQLLCFSCNRRKAARIE